MPADETRFWAKVSPPDSRGCRLWVGALTHNGYGRFRVGPKTLRAHRVAYEMAHGEIPEGLQIDHLCRRPACVAVEHLEAVTPAVNVRRAVHRNSKKHSCPAGHLYDAANTYTDRLGARHCRVCHAATEAARRARLSTLPGSTKDEGS